MRRYGLIILGTVVLAWVVLALALGSPSLTLLSGSGSSASAAASPPCLPGAGERSAALAGTALDVSPAPGSETANPATQISFMGAPPGAIAAISVVGEHSGTHGGRLIAYSQGDGASFVPSTPFAAGERVRVRAQIG